MTEHTRTTPVARVGLIALVFAAIVAIGWTSAAQAQEAVTFRITIENRTNPEMIVTPGAYVVQNTAGAFWTAGAIAPLGLERIAEVGDSTEAVATLSAVAIDAAPAFGDMVTFEIMGMPGDYLSTAQMLVATNDGFVGLMGEPLFDNGSPRSVTIDLVAYDAGTEQNNDLFSGFAGGQPDPAEGAANVDNGTATAEAIAAHSQFTGPQASITIEPVVALPVPAPAPAGNAGLAATTTGTPALLVLAALAATGLLVFAARRATTR